ncbi:MAG: phosphatase PAP2 family protein [Pseudomonadota bacterium]
MARVLRIHLDLISLVALYTMLGWFVVQASGQPERLSLFQYNGIVPLVTALFLIAFAFAYPVYVMLFVRPKRLFGYLASDLRGVWLVPERIVGGAIVFLLLPTVISVYSSIKMLIPVLQPYTWDATFLAWDRVLHGGVDPWRLVQALLGVPLVTSSINFLYNLWFFVLYGMLFWQAFSLRDGRLRMQFLLTMVLLWMLLGGLLATLWSSAGPVYYGRVTGLEDPFIPLMDYLRMVSESNALWALETQENLWQAHVSGDGMIGGGISAMPSLHVATSVAFALLCWRANRWLGILLWGYAGIILLGSVHLAWHYAVDGYVSLILTCLIWALVGRWLSWRNFEA